MRYRAASKREDIVKFSGFRAATSETLRNLYQISRDG
jgi:hypothetical protein